MFSPRRLAAGVLLAGPSRPAFLKYACSFVTVALALVATRSIVDVERAPYFIFFNFAVILTALYAGWRPALLAIGLSALSHYLLLVPPFYNFDFTEPHDLLRLGFFIALGTVIVGFIELLRSALTKLQMTQSKMAELAERYRVTLTSIGDAVIAVDVQERIQFMNGLAETLTGWSLNDAAGNELGTIFNIISELTRKS